jgi:hypothetical protein
MKFCITSEVQFMFSVVCWEHFWECVVPWVHNLMVKYRPVYSVRSPVMVIAVPIIHWIQNPVTVYWSVWLCVKIVCCVADIWAGVWMYSRIVFNIMVVAIIIYHTVDGGGCLNVIVQVLKLLLQCRMFLGFLYVTLNITTSPCNQPSAGSGMRPPSLETEEVILRCLFRAITYLRGLCVLAWEREREREW